MYNQSMEKSNILQRSLSRFLIAAFALGVSYGIWDVANRNRWLQPAVASQSDLTAVVKRTSIPITVIAGGELKSEQSVSVFSEVEGQQIKIVEMVPEGTFAKAGMLVMELDPSEAKRLLSEQEIKLMKAETAVTTATQEVNIQVNLAETAIANASLAKTLAELDRKKYLDGDHQIALSDLRGQIALAESGLQEAEVMVESFQKL
ncbi:MAG TPA: hypothetical protein VM260_25940, partial [Pirellula sp.]|nr:hypothetical protein [Pirellula sp.]